MNANLISEPGAFVENVTDNYSSVSPDMLQVSGLALQQPEYKRRAVEPSVHTMLRFAFTMKLATWLRRTSTRAISKSGGRVSEFP